MDTKLIVSASPHVRSEETTQSLMANVIVALCPCVVASAIIFGLRAVGGEFQYFQKLFHDAPPYL